MRGKLRDTRELRRQLAWRRRNAGICRSSSSRAVFVRSVTSIERHADLAAQSQATLLAQGATNVSAVHADAFAWEPGRQFDAIAVGGAVDAIPDRFLGWLRPGGRMFIVRGRAPAMEAVLVHADVNGARLESLFETDLAYLAGAAPVPAFAL